MKTTIAKEVVLAYPDFTKSFDIYTDASTKQLGSVITQDNRPIAFFSRKLSDAQSKYIVTESELLAIVETLKEFNGILWGQRINVYTDHKNLTRDGLGLTSDRVARWQILFMNMSPRSFIGSIIQSRMQSPDWTMIGSLTRLMSTIMQRM